MVALIGKMIDGLSVGADEADILMAIRALFAMDLALFANNFRGESLADRPCQPCPFQDYRYRGWQYVVSS